jgi:cyclophilin family peptidyl-prolyl cis-trans isomerase
MNRFLRFFLAAALLAFVGCGNQGGNKNTKEDNQDKQEGEAELVTLAMKQLEHLPEEPVFDINTSLGTIRVQLYSDTPKHRDNFAKLALTGYYDGLLFHRVIRNFMIQGGDPLTKDINNAAQFGTGGPGYQIEAEILPNHSHKKGALAAARKGNMANPLKESSGSQFYIVQSEDGCRHLDGEYTIFGETIDGFKVIDDIASVPADGRGLPDSPVRIISVKLVSEIE